MAEATQAAQPSETTSQRLQGATRKKRNPVAKAWRFLIIYPVVPGIVLGLLVIAGVGADYLYPRDPIKQSLSLRALSPTYGRASEFSELPADHPQHIHRYEFFLGADPLGRDILSRIIGGARITLYVAVISLGTGLLLGASMGVIAGYFGGWWDEAITRAVDMWRSIPFILVALVVAAFWDPKTPWVVLFLLSLVAWPPFVRQVRADALLLRSRDFVLAARIAGASHTRIMVKHVLPGTFSTILVVASLSIGSLILTEAALSYLGAGIPDPFPSWGKSVSEGRGYIKDAPFIIFYPGLALFLVVMSFNFFGDWLRDKLDPRLRQLV
ncbi:MAG: ABC transporter permease [SAR202 cluster bacterium]|nr:ABC transporter permease [SAR202 cluster bacterium]